MGIFAYNIGFDGGQMAYADNADFDGNQMAVMFHTTLILTEISRLFE